MFDEDRRAFAEIWPLVENLVSAWKSDPIVGRYPALVAKLLQLPASGPTAQQRYMLKQAFDEVPIMAPSYFELEGVPVDVQSVGRVVGQQFIEQTMWLRSRTKGFPFVCLPQMALGSHLTAQPVGNLPWPVSHLNIGLQNCYVPRGVVAVNAEAAPHELQRRDALLALATAIQNHPQSRRVAECWSRLTPDDRISLRYAKTEATRQLKDFGVQMGQRMRTDPYSERRHRKSLIDSAVEHLPDNAKECCEAFNRLDETLDLIVVDVFEQLFMFGVEDFEIASGTITLCENDGLLRFDSKSSLDLRMGQLISLPGLPGAPIARVESHSYSLMPTDDDAPSWVRSRVLVDSK